MEETISLKELVHTLKKRWSLIVIITLLAIMVSVGISYFLITPIYQNSTQILVNQSKSEEKIFNISDVQTNLDLINTYNVIIKSPVILDIVREELNISESVEALTGKITVQSQQDSQVVNITVQDESPVMAAKIANKTAEVFQKEIVDIMNVDNVNILAKAIGDQEQAPIKPSPLLNMAIALVVGLMASIGLVFLLEYLDNSIKTEQDIEKILELPVLGVIAKIQAQEEVKQGVENYVEKVKEVTE